MTSTKKMQVDYGKQSSYKLQIKTVSYRYWIRQSRLEGHWDSANLRQCYVNFSVVFARWQHRFT